ncbi:MAG: hypothetical protein HC829_08105 [Bacteroidales bacterium]|nr:hypothetical protein [Bacteroidales bacterium]
MEGRPPKRTLKRAVRLHDMAVISSDDLLTIDADRYQEIRRATARARNEGTAAFVCDECGFPVYAPREPTTRLPFWRHHGGAPQNCPWWTGDPKSTDEISASQFKGAQESPLHARLKHVVAELLRGDDLTESGSVIVDEYVIVGDGRRKPDVRATYDGKLIAIEIQLATTQIPIIVAREDFYRETGRFLIWLTWNFEPVERVRLLTAFEDIFYSHNKNLFSLDDAAIARSRERGAFLLRVFWEGATGWNSKLTTLRDLTWPASELPFAVAAWHTEFRSRWLTATTASGTLWPARDKLLDDLAEKLGVHCVSGVELGAADIDRLLNVIFSFVSGKPTGSAQRNLTEVINTFLSSERRHRYARLLRKVITVTAGPEFLEKKSVKDKFEVAEGHAQDDPTSISGRIALLLFPELFEKARRKT